MTIGTAGVPFDLVSKPRYGQEAAKERDLTFCSQPEIDRITSIRKPNAAQLAAFKRFVSAYDARIMELERLNYLTPNTAHHLIDAFGNYINWMNLGDDWWPPTKLTMKAYVDLKFHGV